MKYFSHRPLFQLMVVFSFFMAFKSSAQFIRPPVSPDPGLFQMKLRLGTPSANGIDCPAGAIVAKVSDDNQSIEVRLPTFMTTTSPGVASTRRFCDITLPLKVPPGSAFEVTSLEYSGSAYQAGERDYSFINVRYFFRFLSEVPWGGRNFDGPFKGSFKGSTSNTRDAGTPCGGEAKLSIQVGLDVEKEQPYGTDEAWINLDNGESEPGLRLILKRRQC